MSQHLSAIQFVGENEKNQIQTIDFKSNNQLSHSVFINFLEKNNR